MGLSIQDMHRIIEQDVQKLGFFAYKDLVPQEIDIQINKQIDAIVNGILDKFFRREIKLGEQQGFQRNQVTLDNLRRLHKVVDSTTFVDDTSQKAKAFTLPADYYHHIKSTVVISYKCYDDKQDKEITKNEVIPIRIEPSQFDSQRNPYRRTGRDSVLAEIVDTNLYLYYDDTFDITKLRFSYIKKPAIVKYGIVGGNYDETSSVQTDLDDSLHYMLVNMTSIKIMEILEQNPQKIVNLKQETI